MLISQEDEIFIRKSVKPIIMEAVFRKVFFPTGVQYILIFTTLRDTLLTKDHVSLNEPFLRFDHKAKIMR